MKTQNILAFAAGTVAGYFIFGNQNNDAAMGYTIRQAENNDKDLRVEQSGYGHWKISCLYRGKRIHAITTDSMAIDDWKSDYGEKDGRENRKLRGYATLISQIYRGNYI